jgi:hypothetical protein
MDMKEQKIFNKVATHLLTQNEKSVNELGKCMYRSDDGLKCAIGCLIPKKYYEEGMEDRDIEFIFTNYPDALGKYYRHLDLLEELQHVHDYFEPDEWTRELKVVANNFNLKFKRNVT